MDFWQQIGRSFVESRHLAPEALSAWVAPVLLTVVARGMARAAAASLFGDQGLRRDGRLSPNPLRHSDIFGTLLLPALLVMVKAPAILALGRASPVQFDRLRPRRLGIVGVALIGLAAHLLMASLAILLTASAPYKSWLDHNLENLLALNISLIILNIIPILPLDGGRILWAILPPPFDKLYARSEGWGLPLLILALVVLPLVSFVLGAESFNLLKVIVGQPTEAVTKTMREWIIR